MPVYSQHLREIIKKGIDSKKDYDKPLTGFKIAVDAGNGSGGFLATDVLAPLGADTVGTLQFLPWHTQRQCRALLPLLRLHAVIPSASKFWLHQERGKVLALM